MRFLWTSMLLFAYAFRLHSLHLYCLSRRCFRFWLGTFNLILLFFIRLFTFLLFGGSHHVSQSALDTLYYASCCCRNHSLHWTLLWLLSLFIVWISIFSPLLLHFALLELFFCEFTCSVSQIKPVNIGTRTFLLHLSLCVDVLLCQFRSVEVYAHWLIRSVQHFLSVLNFVLESFSSVWKGGNRHRKAV